MTVIISSYQSINYLPKCLEHLKQQSYRNYEIIVIDAGSTDGSAEFIETNYPEVRLIRCGPIGLGEAINIGIRHASGQVIVFDLNTDEYVDRDWIVELLQMLERFNFKIIAGTTRIIQGTNLIDEAGVDLNLFGQARKIGQKKDINSFQFPNRPVTFTGCPAFHRDLLEKIGMVDEEYFIYAEDLDFCHRARSVGIETRCASKAISHHHIRGTMGANPRRLEYFLRRSNLRFHLIHSKPHRIILNWLYIVCFLIISAYILSICSGKKASLYREKCNGRIEAVLWNLKNLNQSLAMRKSYSKSYI